MHSLEAGWFRRRCGRGFTYHSSNGKRLTGPRNLKRVKSLAIPPAWESVLICPDPDGHIQAMGRDAAGRLQYIYHPEWVTLSASTKFDKLSLFGSLLPKIRRRVRRDLAAQDLSRNRVIAALIRLIDKAHLRVGNSRYAEENGSHGATTLTTKHVDVEDFTISLDYPGKSGQQIASSIADAKLTEVIRQCEEIEGQYLFSYRDEHGRENSVTSSDVNSYLSEVSGERLTAKDFRTWWASVLALRHLRSQLEEYPARSAKSQVGHALSKTAEALGHTKAVCRSSYVHPGLINACENETLGALLSKYEAQSHADRPELTRDENCFLAILPALANIKQRSATTAA